MSGNRVTMQDIARVAEVHVTTVSRALARHPTIPRATRDRIRGVAEKLGYTPDPMLAALVAYRSGRRAPAYQGVLALVTNAATRDGWTSNETIRRQWEGAQQRARELGYQLELFWLREPGMSPERANGILRARNVRGLILACQPEPGLRVELDWPRFAAVAFGCPPAWPALHLVENNNFRSIQQVVEAARARGYRRLGLLISHFDDELGRHSWLGGFLAMQEYWPARERLPVYFYDHPRSTLFLAWLKRHRPDVIISYDRHAFQELLDHGYRIPEDIAYVTPTIADLPRHISGIDENPRETGVDAVDMVVGMLHRGEFGIPKVPKRLLTEGHWREGRTLPVKDVLRAA